MPAPAADMSASVDITALSSFIAANSTSAGINHARRIMVLCSSLSDFLELWSSHCQVKDRHYGDDSNDSLLRSCTRICFFLWHVCAGIKLARSWPACVAGVLIRRHCARGITE